MTHAWPNFANFRILLHKPRNSRYRFDNHLSSLAQASPAPTLSRKPSSVPYSRLTHASVADMAGVNDMYQYSMPWFVNLFVKSIDDSEKSDDIPTRLKTLADWFTYSLYENICRSLFEAHKLLFSFSVTIKILQGDKKIDPEEWRFFLSGSSGSRVEAANPDPSWITSAVWTQITSLSWPRQTDERGRLQ